MTIKKGENKSMTKNKITEGITGVTTLPFYPSNKIEKSEKIVSMVIHQGQVIVATEYHVYRMVDNQLVPVKFFMEEK